jgi:hypothetical protein
MVLRREAMEQMAAAFPMLKYLQVRGALKKREPRRSLRLGAWAGALRAAGREPRWWWRWGCVAAAARRVSASVLLGCRTAYRLRAPPVEL